MKVYTKINNKLASFEVGTNDVFEARLIVVMHLGKRKRPVPPVLALIERVDVPSGK